MLTKIRFRSICLQLCTNQSLWFASRVCFHSSVLKFASEHNPSPNSGLNQKTAQSKAPSSSEFGAAGPDLESALSYLERVHYSSPFAKSLATSGAAQSSGTPASIEAYMSAASARERLSDEVRTEALSHPDYFDVRQLVRVDELVAARVHIGHRSIARNAHMASYLLGSRLDVDIFDLDRTIPLLQGALNFIAHMSFLNGIILFLSRHALTLPEVEQTALECRQFAHCREFLLGTFTNASQSYQKSVRLPDLCIFLGALEAKQQPHIGLRECSQMLIPTVAVCDSNVDPRLVTYPIPGNDDSPSALRLYLRLFREAILAGARRREQTLAALRRRNAAVALSSNEQFLHLS